MDDPLSFLVDAAGELVYNIPISDVSTDGQPSYLKVRDADSDQVSSPAGIPLWGTDGDKIEYFIYRLDPIE